MSSGCRGGAELRIGIIEHRLARSAMGVGQYKRDFRCRPCQSRQCGAPRPAEVPIDAIVEPHRGQLFTRPAVQSTWLVARVLYDGPHRPETRVHAALERYRPGATGHRVGVAPPITP